MNTRYNIGQKLWIMFANRPCEFKVNTIVIRNEGIEYWFSGVFDKGVETIGSGTREDFFRKEHSCFSTKNDLIEGLNHL